MPSGYLTFLVGRIRMWTYGESDPDLVHAMDAFYR